jgi:hypothetical protein
VSALLTTLEKGQAVGYFDDGLLVAVNAHLSTLSCEELDHRDIYDFDRVYSVVQKVHGDFLYLLWRTDDRHHKCSLALTESDLDLHVWLGTGETPALAMAAALLKSLQTVTGRTRIL